MIKRLSTALIRLPAPISQISRGYRLRREREISEERDVATYYDDLIYFMKLKDDGRFNVNPDELRKMVAMSENADEIKICFEAWYNFIGHGAMFTQRDIDHLVLKGIQYGTVEEILDVFKFHQFLMYFPHPDITQGFLELILEAGEEEHFEQIVKIIDKNRLLKLTEDNKKLIFTMMSKIDQEKSPKRINSVTELLGGAKELDSE